MQASQYNKRINSTNIAQQPQLKRHRAFNHFPVVATEYLPFKIISDDLKKFTAKYQDLLCDNNLEFLRELLKNPNVQNNQALESNINVFLNNAQKFQNEMLRCNNIIDAMSERSVGEQKESLSVAEDYIERLKQQALNNIDIPHKKLDKLFEKYAPLRTDTPEDTDFDTNLETAKKQTRDNFLETFSLFGKIKTNEDSMNMLNILLNEPLPSLHTALEDSFTTLFPPPNSNRRSQTDLYDHSRGYEYAYGHVIFLKLSPL